jgi:hypothetical protein
MKQSNRMDITKPLSSLEAAAATSISATQV